MSPVITPRLTLTMMRRLFLLFLMFHDDACPHFLRRLPLLCHKECHYHRVPLRYPKHFTPLDDACLYFTTRCTAWLTMRYLHPTTIPPPRHLKTLPILLATHVSTYSLHSSLLSPLHSTDYLATMMRSSALYSLPHHESLSGRRVLDRRTPCYPHYCCERLLQ